MFPLLAPDESQRLEALRRLDVLDTPAEPAFDRLTALAARLFNVSSSLISLVDDERQWFKSHHGLDLCETPRHMSFCAYAIQKKNHVLVVPDATLDARFHDNPLVIGPPYIRFYAGAPLISREGEALGSLCIIDSHPRELNVNERKTLEDLAAVVVDELELRLAAKKLVIESEARHIVEKELLSSQTLFKSAFQLSATGMALVSPAGHWLQVNEKLCQMFGYSEGELLSGQTFQDITHPDDLKNNIDLKEQLLMGRITSYEIEKRYIRSDGQSVWASLNVAAVRDTQEKPIYLVAQVQDISARKQIEDDLRQSESRKSAILETAIDGIITIDAQSQVIEWNPAAEKIFGYPREEAVGQPMHELIVPPELRAAHCAGLKHYLTTGEGPVLGQRLELPAMCADGRTIIVELAIVPIPLTNPPLFTGHIRDITQKRVIEERLRLLESVAVNANDAILITEAEPVDEPGPRILYANEAYYRMSGYTAEEIVGKTPRILQGAGTSQETRNQIRRALKKWQPFVTDILNYKKDGTPFWVELSITPVANEKGWFTHWVSIQRDITERRQTLEALRESEARYHNIAGNVPGMVYQLALNREGALNFNFVSEGCRELYELEPEQLLVDPSLIIKHVYPDDRQSLQTSIELSAQLLKPWEWQGRMLLPSGKIKWIRGTSRPKLEEDGHIVWDGILFDVTQNVQGVEALRTAKTEAECARAEAERANATKSEFLSRMSHELRTPLNAILGFGQLLERQPLEKRAHQQVGYILNGGNHLLNLINEVLDISRIETGNLVLAPERVCIVEVVSEVLELLQPLADEHGIKLHSLCSSSSFAFADHQRLKQVLLNLLSNAVKYNHEGGSVSLSCHQHKADDGSKCLCIDVSDTGPGIAPEDMERLWAPFDRLGAERHNIEGTGIGLTLSRRLAEAMQGTLTAKSVLNEGSTFTLALPLPTSRTEGDNFVSPDVPPSTSHVVLYIEDKLPTLRLVQAIWADRTEIRLLSANRASKALEIARTHQPDVILLDLSPSDMKAEDVLKQLQHEKTTCGIPVVIIGTGASTTQLEGLRMMGATASLTKPLDVDRFRETLDGLLRHSKMANRRLV